MDDQKKSLIHSDTDPEITALQIKLLREASPAKKLAMVEQMNQTVKMLALSGLKSRYPDDSPEKLKLRLAVLLLGRELAAKAYDLTEIKD